MSLGKGLGALIKPSAKYQKKSPKNFPDLSAEEVDKLWQVPISEIFPNASQPRKKFDEAALAELAASIKTHGILQPLLLSEQEDGGYELIAGERRWRAAKIAGLTTLPALVKKLARQEKVEISLIENIQREDLNPIEEAFAFKRLVEEFNLTQQAVADKVGKSRPAIANTLRLLDLPEEAQRALMEKKINAGQARGLLSLKNRADQLTMLASMLGQKMTVREVEDQARRKKNSDRQNANLSYFEEKLREALSTKVTINGRENRGKINITYYSSEEFKELMEKLIKS